MTNDPTVNQYLTKNELYEEFGRHPRTITDDIKKAITIGDRELLMLARLQTKNDDIVEGVDVSSSTWKELSDKGENPTWYFKSEFVELVLKRKPRWKSKKKQSPSAPPKNDSAGSSKNNNRRKSVNSDDGGLTVPKLPDDPVVRGIVLEHLHYAEQHHKEERNELTSRILDLVSTSQTLQSQTNTLLQQFKLSDTDSSSQNEPSVTLGSREKEQGDSEVITVEAVVPKTASPKPQPKKKKTTSTTKASPQKSKTQKKSKNKTVAKTPKEKSTQKKQPGFFDRLFGS